MTYTDVLRKMDKLTAAQRATVSELQAQAWAYVWGWQDAGGARGPFNDSWEFGVAYAAHCVEFELGERGMRAPIQNAWQCWMKGLPIT